MKKWLVAGILLVPSIAFGQTAPVPNPAQTLSNDWQAMSGIFVALNNLYPRVADDLKAYGEDMQRQIAALKQQVSDGEAQKETLIQWLKEAQEKAK